MPTLLHKIKDSFFEVKPETCIRFATQYLEVRPYDIDVRYMRAKSYRNIGEFDKAIEDLEFNIETLESGQIKNIEQLKDTFTELFYIYYHSNQYIDALKLLPIIYDNKFVETNSVYLKELIMKKQLRLPIEKFIGPTESYLENQIMDYNERRALGYVGLHSKSDIDINKKSKFADNLDLEYLFNIIKNNLNHNNKANIDEAMEVHYFTIPNVGIYKNDICNYIKVRVVPNTKNIISIFPITALKYEEAQNLDYDRDKLFKKEKVKEKRISQIDKFNKRYNR